MCADCDLHLRRPLIAQNLAAASHEDAPPSEVGADDTAAVSSARRNAKQVGALLLGEATSPIRRHEAARAPVGLERQLIQQPPRVVGAEHSKKPIAAMHGDREI